MLRHLRGHPFDQFTKWTEHSEILVPVLPPDLVPRGHERDIRAYGRKLRREHRKVRKDRGHDQVVFLDVAPERCHNVGGELDRLGNGATIIRVNLPFVAHCTEGKPIELPLGRAIPEMPSVDSHLVSANGETSSDLVNPFLGAPHRERIDDIRDEGDVHSYANTNVSRI